MHKLYRILTICCTESDPKESQLSKPKQPEHISELNKTQDNIEIAIITKPHPHPQMVDTKLNVSSAEYLKVDAEPNLSSREYLKVKAELSHSYTSKEIEGMDKQSLKHKNKKTILLHGGDASHNQQRKYRTSSVIEHLAIKDKLISNHSVNRRASDNHPNLFSIDSIAVNPEDSVSLSFDAQKPLKGILKKM